MSMPLLLLDENIGQIVAMRLRDAGFDVASVLESSRGMTDAQVLQRAQIEKRILVTLDRDFGSLVFRDSNRHVGVLFLRLKRESADNISASILAVLTAYGEKLQRKFTVVSESRVRMR